MQVHIIKADHTDFDGVQKHGALGKAIGALARRTNETVFFHDFSAPLGGEPVIMLECSDAFLEQVKQLPGFKETHPVWEKVATERSQNVQDFYMGNTPPFVPGNDPGPV